MRVARMARTNCGDSNSATKPSSSNAVRSSSSPSRSPANRRRRSRRRCGSSSNARSGATVRWMARWTGDPMEFPGLQAVPSQLSYEGPESPFIRRRTSIHVISGGSTSICQNRAISSPVWCLLERHLHQCIAQRMGAGLPFRLHAAVEILLGELREESFLLRDDFLHVGPERLHRSDLIEIFLAHRGVRRCALGGDVQPAVVDGEDVMEDVLQRLVGRLAVLQEFVLRQLCKGLAVVAQDPPVVIVDVAEVGDARHDSREAGCPDKGYDGQSQLADAFSRSRDSLTPPES